MGLLTSIRPDQTNSASHLGIGFSKNCRITLHHHLGVGNSTWDFSPSQLGTTFKAWKNWEVLHWCLSQGSVYHVYFGNKQLGNSKNTVHKLKSLMTKMCMKIASELPFLLRMWGLSNAILPFPKMSAIIWFAGMPNHPIKTTIQQNSHQTTGRLEKHPLDSNPSHMVWIPQWLVFNTPTRNGWNFVNLCSHRAEKKTNQLVLSSPNHQTSLALEKTRKMKPLSSKERWHGGARCFRIPHSGRRWNSTNPNKKQYSPLQATNSYHRGEILMKFDPLWFFIIIIHSCMVYFSMFWQGP